jgi:hypothetical protein
MPMYPGCSDQDEPTLGLAVLDPAFLLGNEAELRPFDKGVVTVDHHGCLVFDKMETS